MIPLVALGAILIFLAYRQGVKDGSEAARSNQKCAFTVEPKKEKPRTKQG